MFAIGYDIGSSSIKAALINLDSGETLETVQYPKVEMKIISEKLGWAEQHPETWWEAVCICTKEILAKTEVDTSLIKSVGISYQMHGLVLVDKNLKVLRPSIIWCDSRAIDIGDKAFQGLGSQYCIENLLNSPGNFTASKLRWVKEHESEIYNRIHKILLPGDYISMKFTNELSTTITGLSEGIFWDFKEDEISDRLLDYYGVSKDLIPKVKTSTDVYGTVTAGAAAESGLAVGTAISYKAGDQPNNAMSLSVLSPGDIAATGGTSGVVYGVVDNLASDQYSRINSFAHVNHTKEDVRIGQLLCINGAGIQYAWIKNQLTSTTTTYEDLEESISKIPVGSEGLRIIPFGNGAERMINNKITGGQVNNLQFHVHSRDHMVRAALEGIAFSFVFGIKVLQELGLNVNNIKVGNDNLFQSEVFSSTICNLLNCEIQMIKTTGAIGAAKASGIGIKKYSSFDEAMSTSTIIKTYTPSDDTDIYQGSYNSWAGDLTKLLND